MSSVMISPQGLLGSLVKARVENKPMSMNSRTASEPSNTVQPPPAEMQVMPAAKPAAWDPHEVWLSRVKMPREQRSV